MLPNELLFMIAYFLSLTEEIAFIVNIIKLFCDDILETRYVNDLMIKYERAPTAFPRNCFSQELIDFILKRKYCYQILAINLETIPHHLFKETWCRHMSSCYPNNYYTIRLAARNNINLYEYFRNDISEGLNGACEGGHLSLVKLYLRSEKIEIYGIYYAINNNHLHIVEYLTSVCQYCQYTIYQLIRRSIVKKHFEITKYLLTLYNDDYDLILVEAINSIEMVKFLVLSGKVKNFKWAKQIASNKEVIEYLKNF